MTGLRSPFSPIGCFTALACLVFALNSLKTWISYPASSTTSSDDTNKSNGGIAVLPRRNLVANDEPNMKCLGLLANTGMIPMKSWGTMSEADQATWKELKCDWEVEKYAEIECPELLKEANTTNPNNLPLDSRKEWDQLLCGKVMDDNLRQKGKFIKRGFKEAGALPVGRTGGSGGGSKPQTFPRDVRIYEPLPPWPKNGARKKVKIVLWNQFQWFFLWHTPEYQKDVQKHCSTDCTITSNRGQAQGADAIIVHAKTHRASDFPKNRSPKTKLILASLEQPGYAPMMANKNYMAHYDFYTTYQLDSFVPITSVETEWKIWEFYPPKWPSRSQKKGFASSFIGNCRNAGAEKRTAYVKQLMQYIEVDNYGGCKDIKNKDEMATLGVKNDKEMSRKDRKHTLMGRYKFYLAFENSNVYDYTSEKVFEGLRAHTLPVYRGSASIDMLLPHPRSIINANDMSPKELADYLKKVANDEALYNSYFDWKKEPVKPEFERVMEHCAHNWTSMCHICHHLSLLQES